MLTIADTSDDALPPEASHVFQAVGFSEPATLNEILDANSDEDGWTLSDEEVTAFCSARIGDAVHIAIGGGWATYIRLS